MNNKRDNAGSRPIQLTIAFNESQIACGEDDTRARHGTGATETRHLEPPAEPVPSSVGAPPSAREALRATSEKGRQRKWYSLIDKVYALPNLQRAWERVAENKGAAGIDGLTIEMFTRQAEARLQTLSQDLKAKTYRPQPVRRVHIPKADGGKRPLGIPTVRDRIVQQALLQILSPIFEPRFSARSHGFRPGRGCHTALEVVDRAVMHGYEWVVDADIKGFFDNVDHQLLLAAINEEVADGSVLRLIQSILEAGVIEPDTWEREPTELGTPQGGPLSPLLANIYLTRLDRALAGEWGLVRYADDFVIFARSESEAEQALAKARAVLEGELNLTLHPEKTRVVTVDSGFEFLGFRYFRHKGKMLKVIRRKSEQKFRDKINELTPRIKNQRKPKARNFSLDRLAQNPRLRVMIAKLNRFLKSWYAYFRQAWFPEKYAFTHIDKTVRRRLRQALTGRLGNGWWLQVLRNDMFDALNLFSLRTTYLRDSTSRIVYFPAGPTASPQWKAVCGKSARAVWGGRRGVTPS